MSEKYTIIYYGDYHTFKFLINVHHYESSYDF